MQDSQRPDEARGLARALKDVVSAQAVSVSRRRFLFFSAAVAGTSLLAACGGGEESPAATTSASNPTATTATSSGSAGTTPAATSGTTAASPAASASPGALPTQRTGTVAKLPVTAAPGKAGGKNIYKVANQPDIQNLDPATITGQPDYNIGEAIFNFIGRYTYNPPLGTDIIPELAEKWDIAPDAKTFTFHIRKGVKFHKNYGDLTAEDVKWNWARIQDKATASRYQTDFAGAQFDVVDANTLKVSFEKAYPSFIRASLAFRPGMIVSPKAMQEKGDAWKTEPIGTGPFEWTKLDPGVGLTLSRFEGYWGPKPKVDQITFRFKIDDRAAILAVAKGELDAFYISEPDIAIDVSKKTDPNTTFVKADFGQSPYWIAFHMKKPPLDNVKVRQALRYAIDVNSIAKDLYGGLADPVHSFLPPFMFGYSDNITKFNYDPEKAKSMHKESGVNLSSWQPVMMGSGASVDAKLIHEAVASYWTDVGVKVKNDLPEYGIFLERRRNGDYDMFGISVGRIEPDQIATPYWYSTSPPTANNSFYTLADDLIDRAKSEPDTNKRKELYRQLQDKISVDSPAAFTVATSVHLLANKRVAGLYGASWQSRVDWVNVDVPAE
jgi:ABC-type transport system substrate-binding protein